MKRIKYLLFALLLAAGCDDFFERDISGDSVEIIAPVDNVSVPEGEVSFLWNVLEGADHYRLIIVSPSFAEAASPVCDVLVAVDSVAVSCMHTQALAKGEYEWSLRGLNSAWESLETISGITVGAAAEDTGDQ